MSPLYLPHPETPHHPLLHTPEMQKAAVSGLIEEIVVQPTAALEPVLKSKLISESFHFTGKYPQNQLISPLK